MSHDVVWITGASSGIGEAVSKEFAKSGSKVIISARREAELERVKADMVTTGVQDSDIFILPLDVTDFETMPEKVLQAFSVFGRIDLLFNNAGISQRAKCIETTMDTYRNLFEVDVFGQIALTKETLPKMIDQGSGHIAVTASVAGKIGVPFRTGYCAAKHAMMGFFDALRGELDADEIPIDVSCIVPGFIKTAIAENSISGDGSRFGKKDKVIEGGMPADKAAVVIVKGLKARKKEINVGQGVEMHGLWIKRFFPNLIFKLAANMGKPKKA